MLGIQSILLIISLLTTTNISYEQKQEYYDNDLINCEASGDVDTSEIDTETYSAENNNRTPTVVYLNTYVNDTYSTLIKEYQFYSNKRQIVSINYVGAKATLNINYALYPDYDDRLCSANLNNYVDVFLFEQDTTYILQFCRDLYTTNRGLTFQLTTRTFSNMTNHDKYILHQTMDSTSAIGYRYNVIYDNYSSTNYTDTNYYISGDSPTSTYVNAIDNTHWFYDPNYHSFTDNRRVVTDTGCDEFNAIAFAYSTVKYYSDTYGEKTYNYRFSGTFISETSVLTCAHTIFSSKNLTSLTYLEQTGLTKNITFTPGINDYSSTNYYGTYSVTEIYAPISYVIRTYENTYAYNENVANYDWALCKTTNTIVGTKTHSYMGVSLFNISPGLTSWDFARSAGYPALQSTPVPNDSYLYYRTLWTSYPRVNSVTVVDNHAVSNEIFASKGNSGGPLYFKQTTVYNGNIVTSVYVVGVFSGYHDYLSSLSTFFFKNTPYLIHVASTYAL